ncbi:Inositol hexaphosphate kinase KCS1 [Penicillium hetheringtonii]|uniref:Kinase n=1 Tax=Penicillium hetheringtonii TaxID=911720 RepID=A0AAD6GZH4_9EURO|nr:Inositol hexaphosphate kinase KCS1 [Penicillium hetheringtonii]
MSNPPPAPEHSLPGPLVTPAAPAQHDCSETDDKSVNPRHHLSQDQHLFSGGSQQEMESPSRAESPTIRQWSQPTPAFAPKKNPDLTLGDFFPPRYFSYGANTPQLPPEKAVDNEHQINLIPGLDNVPGSPTPASKVSPSILTHYPLRPPSHYSTSHLPRLSLLRSSISSVDQLKSPEGEASVTVQPVPSGDGETGTKTSDFDNACAERTFLPSAIDDVSHSPGSLSPLRGHDQPSTDTEAVPFPPLTDSGEAPLEGGSSRGRRGRVDNSIEANLTNAELASNVRSRKSSHYLGLFKENTTSPDRKRWEDRERTRPHEGHAELGPAMDFEKQHFKAAPDDDQSLRKSISLPSLSDGQTFEPPSPVDPSHQADQEEPPKRPWPTLPLSLLEEIRNFHLTPGGGRGSSFSRSIPTQYAERGRDYFQAEPHVERFSESMDSLEDEAAEHSPQFEDEEENEQISSAVYFPHEPVTVPEDGQEEEPMAADSHSVQKVQLSADKGHELMLIPQERSTTSQQEVGHVDISFRSKNESKILHGDISGLRSPADGIPEMSLSTISEHSHGNDSSVDTEPPSADESVQSMFDESSLTDDADTPTATPIQKSRLATKRKTTGPLGAVELKPYRHQVGGHTTVFRFSRRAVCKQLNNRENEFYERIERRHPDMLVFLPRYIGVLNVTFSKTSKRPKGLAEQAVVSPEKVHTNGSATVHSHVVEAPEPQRIVSQSQITGVIPKVILENNRHIIPADLFGRPQRPDSSAVKKRKNKIWGATTVNRKLQEQVLREVFSPPAVHQHRRHARGHLNLTRTASDIPHRRGNMSEDHTSSSRSPGLARVHSLQTPGMDIPPSNSDGVTLSSSASTAFEDKRARDESTKHDDPNRANSLNGGHQSRRRHSGGGLQRRGSLNSRNNSELVFFDDEGYGGDREDEIFSMEGDALAPPKLPSTTLTSASSPVKQSSSETQMNTFTSPSKLHDAAAAMDHKGDESHLPSNPKDAQLRKDERVQFFLLLEDLTAGMNKPCVLDLKMGTRQYGIEANEKKKKSSKTQMPVDYFTAVGRPPVWYAGVEYALTRFLYDGVSHNSVTKKIPVILEKLSLLEHMIRKLDRYRLYASSLLILYDGEPSDPTPPTANSQSNERPGLQRRSSDDGHNNTKVQLKIVDFANCVTGEDELPPDTPCPPHHPMDIDRGYLRGLRTLRMYFQRIMKEIGQDEFVERGEGEAIALGSQPAVRETPSDQYYDESVMETDTGEVSF